MPYSKDNVLHSRNSYEVLRKLANSDYGSYGKKIAEETDMNRSLVAQIISKFKELEFVEKARRDKAQYYQLTDNGEKYFQKVNRAHQLRKKAEKLEKSAKMEVETE